LAVPSYHELGIRKLQPAYENLFIDLGPFPKFKVRRNQKRRGANLDMGTNPNRPPANNGKEANRDIITYFDVASTKDAAQPEGNATAYLVTAQAVKKSFERAWKEADEEDFTNWKTRLGRQHSA